MDLIQKIKHCFESSSAFYSNHARREMENEAFGRILENEVFETVCKGEVIEEYPDDNPYPSCLIYGNTSANRPLHVVCAYNSDEKITIVITVYQPDSELWVDFKKRKKT